jgi:hypothetical protein
VFPLKISRIAKVARDFSNSTPEFKALMTAGQEVLVI